MRLSRVPVAFALVLLCSVCVAIERDIPYSTGSWDAEAFGNHRAVLRVTHSADAVRVHVPWRRRDSQPETKLVLVVDARTGKQLANVRPVDINRQSGDLVFQPSAVPGDYYLYYLPYASEGRSNYPTVKYRSARDDADPAWVARHGLQPCSLRTRGWMRLPQAVVLRFESLDAFNTFYPMEVIASASEVRRLLERYPAASYLAFPEDRANAIRMDSDLPMRWVRSRDPFHFDGSARRGEFYSFQIGVYAVARSLDDVRFQFAALKRKSGGLVIPAEAFRCFNTDGIDWAGKSFVHPVSVGKGKIGASWMGIQVPVEAEPGEYEGAITVLPANAEKRSVPVTLRVTAASVADAGDSDPANLSRLRWLDSQLAADDEVSPPFTPLEIQGNDIRCLGRAVRLDLLGFPESIRSYFTPGVTGIAREGREVLSAPVSFIVQDGSGDAVRWNSSGTRILKHAPGRIEWEAGGTAAGFELRSHAFMDFDGTMEYAVTLKVIRDAKLTDVRLELPIREDASKYMMGMGVKGGFRPSAFRWKWDPKKNQDSLWVGDVNAGLQAGFKDENYVRPLNTNFYLLKPLNMPPSWYNGGQGGCDITTADGTCRVRVYSGPRNVAAGSELHFNFRLVPTPFKPVDTDSQWSTRYYHRYAPVDEIARAGGNTINVHHATPINPYINYPFLRPSEMKAYVDDAHRHGMKVKIYYTVRELSNRAPELFALRSLGDEVLSYGPGGGFSWLQEHLGSNYIAAWFVPELRDAAVINSGVSRWHNYYVEGLQWLVQNVGIDGLYIDDVAFDRITMKRVRKVLDRGRPGAMIDLHSANQFNVRDGFANSANLYLEHFPYLNRLWFGEYFDYNSRPDFWLVETSGIPFGLMGEMLQDGGNVWRGMVFGMTGRLPYSGNPVPMWKAWDDFGMLGSRMVGYWVPSPPVKTGNDDVPATCYVRDGRTLVSLASWAPGPVAVRLQIDWKALGLDEGRAKIAAPAIAGFQEAHTFRVGEEIAVQPGKGWILVVSN
jgi:hypothetical protein